jgi:hypothetical protein
MSEIARIVSGLYVSHRAATSFKTRRRVLSVLIPYKVFTGYLRIPYGHVDACGWLSASVYTLGAS